MESGVSGDKTLSEKLREVFEHKNLQEYLHDKNYLVRYTVCETGFGLETLLNDPEPAIRRQVAMQQYGLDKLLYDCDEWVRAAVAQQGYGLNLLLKDESKQVRNVAARIIKEQEQKPGLTERMNRAEQREARVSNCFTDNSYKRGRRPYEKERQIQ